MKTPWSYFEESAPFNWQQVARNGRSDPYHITYQKLINASGTLLEVRSFLYYEIGMKELYRGDGFTYTLNGSKGYPEYFAVNQKVSDFNSHCYQELKFNF